MLSGIEADVEMMIGEMSTENIGKARQIISTFKEGQKIAIAELLVAADIEGVGSFERVCMGLREIVAGDVDNVDERVLFDLFLRYGLTPRGEKVWRTT